MMTVAEYVAMQAKRAEHGIVNAERVVGGDAGYHQPRMADGDGGDAGHPCMAGRGEDLVEKRHNADIPALKSRYATIYGRRTKITALVPMTDDEMCKKADIAASMVHVSQGIWNASASFRMRETVRLLKSEGLMNRDVKYHANLALLAYEKKDSFVRVNDLDRSYGLLEDSITDHISQFMNDERMIQRQILHCLFRLKSSNAEVKAEVALTQMLVRIAVTAYHAIKDIAKRQVMIDCGDAFDVFFVPGATKHWAAVARQLFTKEEIHEVESDVNVMNAVAIYTHKLDDLNGFYKHWAAVAKEEYREVFSQEELDRMQRKLERIRESEEAKEQEANEANEKALAEREKWMASIRKKKREERREESGRRGAGHPCMADRGAGDAPLTDEELREMAKGLFAENRAV